MAMKFRLAIPDSNFAVSPFDRRLSFAFEIQARSIASSRLILNFARAKLLFYRFYPGLRPALMIAAIGSLHFLVSCFSTPDWIHRLPRADELIPSDAESGSSAESELNPGLLSVSPENLVGTYLRPVSSRYSVADSHSLSSSTQLLKIENDNGNLIFYRIHTYEEWVRGKAFRNIYGEKGTVELKGPWVLFRSRFVYHSSQGPVLMDHEESDRKCIQPMSVDMALKKLDIRKKMVERKPLLYFFNAGDSSITPLAFEEEGKVFRFGFYEQLMGPYDTGTMLQETHKDLSLQTQNPHSYFKEGSAFLRNYSRDPAMDVQKEMGLSTECIQDLRPIQSIK